MPITKASGDMYDKEWIQWCASLIVGHCEHECGYCFVPTILSRFKSDLRNEPLRWASDVKFRDGEIIAPKLKAGRTFICHTTDMFADNVPADWIKAVLEHCYNHCWDRNGYLTHTHHFVFQTKNPKRYMEFENIFKKFPSSALYGPPRLTFGTTIETNRDTSAISKAPLPYDRMVAFRDFIDATQYKSFVTIEPIIDCDLDEFISWFQSFIPDLIWIGADSKNSKLPEPSKEKVKAWVKELSLITEVKIKNNLKRIVNI